MINLVAETGPLLKLIRNNKSVLLNKIIADKGLQAVFEYFLQTASGV
jgi:hypothetical protein